MCCVDCCWQQQPVNTTHDYTNCYLYRVDSPDDEQQACSKHVEAYHRNKLIEKSASCWFILYGYITMQGQQNFKITWPQVHITIHPVTWNYIDNSTKILIFPLWRLDPICGHGLPLRSFAITLIGHPRTNYQPEAETCTWQHITLIRERHSCLGGIRTSNPSQWTAAEPCFRPHGHCHWWENLLKQAIHSLGCGRGRGLQSLFLSYF